MRIFTNKDIQNWRHWFVGE